jgi:acyl-CoA thioesterase FadM
VLITRRAEHEFERETFPFDEVECELNVTQLKRCSLWLEFRFYSGGRKVGQGRQQIVFANHARQIIPFPEHVADRMRHFERR